MMRIKNIFRPAMVTAALLLAASCTKDDLAHDNPVTGQGEETVINLTYSIEAMASGDGITPLEGVQTRVVPGDITDNAPEVKNMWVLQFDGKSATSKLMGAPRFIGSDELNATPLSVPLIQSSSECYTLFVANIKEGIGYNWNLSTQSTFADALTRVKNITEEIDCYETLGGDKTLVMSAVTETPVVAGIPLTPQFKRSVAKVTLNLELANANMEIISVRLRNVAKTINYADAGLPKAGLTETAIFPEGSIAMDYDVVTDGMPANGETKSFSWYVPRNQKGVNTNSIYAKDKTFYAPPYATYFEIVAVKKNGADIEATSIFRVYPGANQKDDYNLCGNKHYTIGLKVEDIGTDVNDSRVETFGTMDYTSIGASSNAFILNPAPRGGGTRTYQIPVSQVNRYWGGNAPGYGNDPAFVIGDNDQWQIELIWSDLDGLFGANFDTQIALKDNNGLGAGKGQGSQHFELTVPAGLPAGNFTLGVKKGASEILWSWHFWVTDYNPDSFNRSVITSGKYTYPVPGGQVERYEDNGTTGFWNNVYSNTVMMDRSLGAVENYFNTQPANGNRGILHYQFGRKDPFPSCAVASGSATVVLKNGTTNVKGTMATPNTFYYIATVGGNWCTEVADLTYNWHDPLSTDNSKSIYDPCPPGWRMPVGGVWTDFNRQVDGALINTQNPLRDLGWTFGRGVGGVSKQMNGLRYWPGTSATAPVEGTIWYPATGCRYATTGGLNHVGSYGYYWSGNPNQVTSGRFLKFDSASVNPHDSAARGYGFAVRCVAEYQ